LKVVFTYVGIRATRMEKSVEFYTRLLKMKEVGRSKIVVAKGEVVNLASPDVGFSLEPNAYDKDSAYNTKYVVGEGLDHLAFKTEDLDEFLAEAQKLGYPVAAEMKTQKSPWAYIKDPNGIWIEPF